MAFLKGLFVNPVDSHREHSSLSVQVLYAVVLGKGDIDFHCVARMGTDELVFKAVNVGAGADHQVCACAVCASAISVGLK